MKSSVLFTWVVFFLTIRSTSVSASVTRSYGQVLPEVWQWAGENTILISVVAAAVILVITAFLLLRRKGAVKSHPGSVEAEAIPNPDRAAIRNAEPAEKSRVRNREAVSGSEAELGRSIVRAAWILGISAIICVLLILANHRYRSARYAPLDKLTYIDTWTGKCYYSDGREIN